MEMIKLGCCIDLHQLPTACELGFEFVDLSGKELVMLSPDAVEELADYLSKKGISCLGIHAALPENITLTGASYEKEVLRQYMEKLIARARLLKVRYIGIGSPKSRQLPEGMIKSQADFQMREALTLLCDMAPDMDFLLEGLNREETNYINTLLEAYEMVQQIDRKNIGMVWDIYHFLKNGECIAALPDTLPERVKYLHIADPNGRRYPSKNSSRELFETMNAAVKLTKVQYLAIEAVSQEFETDAFQGKNVLLQQLE